MNKQDNRWPLGISLCCMALCAACNSSHTGQAAGTPHSQTTDMICFTSADSPKAIVSSVFTVRTYPPERMIEEPWAKDFRRYIGQSGNEGGISVTCSQVGSGDAQKSKAEELRKQGHEVVETRWSYAGG